jgi:hypothetical protein
MPLITRDSLMSLEAYSKDREAFRARVITHKRNRTVHLGANVTLLFEDELTMRYQVQEMLRAERIFEDEGIRHELEAYNPLVPDGTNWKATMLIEYPEEQERRVMLSKLLGIESRVWVQVGGHSRVFAIADEDLERETETKTSSVHFLRFELEPAMIETAIGGGQVSAGVDHPEYQVPGHTLAPQIAAALALDLAR